MLDWESYPIPGVTYGHNSHYLSPFAVFKLDPQKPDDQSSQINSSQAVLRCEYPTRPRSRGHSVGTANSDDVKEARPQNDIPAEDVNDRCPAGQNPSSTNSNGEGSHLARLNSNESIHSEFPENSGNVPVSRDQDESGPGSFTSTSTNSSAVDNNMTGAACDDEGVVEDKQKATPSAEGRVEAEPSKSHKVYQVNTRKLSRDNRIT